MRRLYGQCRGAKERTSGGNKKLLCGEEGDREKMRVSKLEEGSRAEHLQAQKCRVRLDHLESADAENMSEWNNTRMKRILVDYMLRMSYYDTAVKLAESSNLQVRDVVGWLYVDAGNILHLLVFLCYSLKCAFCF